MPIRIAIPEPTATDAEYNGRSLPPYIDALEAAGATPVIISLAEVREKIAQLVAGADGILLPGSRYDVDPARYGEARIPECGEVDPVRTTIDELFLEHAFAQAKPVLAICHGVQSLNVWRNGALIQDLKTAVNHRPGRDVVEAHPVHLAEDSRLIKLLSSAESPEPQVNSSHHQAVRAAGRGLRIVAVSPDDGVVEAVELDAPDHFVVGVQWHPERTYAQSAFSRSVFAEFVRAAQTWNRAPGPAEK